MSGNHHSHSCCAPGGKRAAPPSFFRRVDWLLWVSGTIVAALYLIHWLFPGVMGTSFFLQQGAHTIFMFVNTVWWGVLVGIVMLALLSKIPREFVMSILGSGGGLRGILRATLAGILLDLCSHGILMVGVKLYERGATIGQVIAFLVASPWNSFSLTLILIALVGAGWTVLFIVLSAVIAIISGLIFERLVTKGTLPSNPHRVEIPEGFRFWPEARKRLRATRYTPALLGEMLLAGIKDSRMVLRWLLFGILLAALLRASISEEMFRTYLGPGMAGLFVTMLAATLLEVCSEGSTPIAADILTRAQAPGNSFAFLMTGVSTDYTEIMVLRDATKSWKIALFLPLVTVPQVLLLAWFINYTSL